MQEVVAVDEGQVFSAYEAESQVAGLGHASVGLVDDPDAGVGGGIGVEQRAASVGAAVVHAYGFPVLEALRPEAVQASAEELFGVVDRDYD